MSCKVKLQFVVARCLDYLSNVIEGPAFDQKANKDDLEA